ncbi:MAG: YceD family protein [Solirubrobacterales bacterium]
MPPITDQLDLGRLGLKAGGGTRFETAVRVGAFEFGEQRYALADDPVIVTVDVSRTTSGYVVRLRCTAEIEGPCMRCYDDFALVVPIDHSEIHEPHLDEDMASEYVDDGKLDVSGVLRDAIGLALPTSISGPIGSDGRCGACNRSEPELAALGIVAELKAVDRLEAESEPDPRWAKLRELDL